MSSQFDSDEDLLTRLVREAGDPSVAPDLQYARTLRETILDGVGPAKTVAPATEGIRKADVSPIITLEGTRRMTRIAKVAVAATVLVALCILTSWMTIGSGSTNIAFARVADALDSLQSATFDMTSEAMGEKGQPPATATSKGFFLAPSHQRIETSTTIGPAKIKIDDVTIVDGREGKSIILNPMAKSAIAMDMKKMREDMEKSGQLAKGAPTNMFETVRRLVREGSSGTGEKAERLGRKEIDGREAVGFRLNAGMMDMTLWADPETAWPIRIEIVMDVTADVRMVMNNFRYNVDLDPSLFSLEPPEGYSTQAMEMTMPVEKDLLRTLRTIAEHGKGVFPAELDMNQMVMVPQSGGFEFKLDELAQEKAGAAMEKVVAKYGGRAKLKAKYGKDIPPAIMAEIKEAAMPFMLEQLPSMQEQRQKHMQKHMQKQMPFSQERMQQARGIAFYMMLKPENDPHYVGGGLKLGTPDCPILWYKPTDVDKYRVIYADLSVKDMTPDDVKKLPEATPK